MKLYVEYTKDVDDKIGFINFSDLEKQKNKNGGSVSKDEYDTINNLIGTHFRYFKIYNNTYGKLSKNEESILIDFLHNIDLKTRFEIIALIHKIGFNVTEERMITGQETDFIDANDIYRELYRKISNNPNDYQTITRYLNIDTSDISTNNENFDTKLGETLKSYFINPDEKLKTLLSILNNEKLRLYTKDIHPRMRILERIILKYPNISEHSDKIEKNIDKFFLELTRAINKKNPITITNYCNTKRLMKASKFAARIHLDDVKVGIDKNGNIHTIYINGDN